MNPNDSHVFHRSREASLRGDPSRARHPVVDESRQRRHRHTVSYTGCALPNRSILSQHSLSPSRESEPGWHGDASDEAFDELDLNGDGFISRHEWLSSHERKTLVKF